MNEKNTPKHLISTLVGALILIIEVAIFSVLFFVVSWQVESELFFAIPFIKESGNLNVNEVTNVNSNNSNLGVYANTKYQYTVTLPTGWRANIDEFCSIDNVGFGQDKTGEKYKCPPDGGGWMYNISAIQNTTITAVQEDTVIKNHPDAKVVDDTINGKSAKHYLYTFTSEYLGGTFTQEGYLVNNVSTVFDIWMQSDGSVTEYDSAFGQFAKLLIFTDETAGWKTYTNTDFGYSIKYPKDLLLDSSYPAAITFGKVTSEPGPGAFFIDVKENQSLSFLTQYKQGFPDGCPQESDTTIAGATTKKIVCIDSSRQEIQYYFIEKNNNIYQLSYIIGDKQLDPTFEKMVITFQFTD